ncbi:GNAT family N-acetyltransferase [Sphingomonas sp. MMS24-J13]|uniref:GNAT family N-acetyltransferase n=1 Tax=Sphingomonas sp. MMS24-J13 TaxID=3238686 RepID=UPI00384AA661
MDGILFLGHRNSFGRPMPERSSGSTPAGRRDGNRANLRQSGTLRARRGSNAALQLLPLPPLDVSPELAPCPRSAVRVVGVKLPVGNRPNSAVQAIGSRSRKLPIAERDQSRFLMPEALFRERAIGKAGALPILPALRHSLRMSEMIRLATIDDAAAVTALTRSAYSKWVSVIGREPLPMRVDHAAHIRDHRADLLFVGEELAALVETIERDDDVLIENVAVDPSFQKRGYGRRMVAYAEQLARDAGLTTVRLYTNQMFQENLRLYASLGYEVEREEALNGGVAIHMVKVVV